MNEVPSTLTEYLIRHLQNHTGTGISIIRQGRTVHYSYRTCAGKAIRLAQFLRSRGIGSATRGGAGDTCVIMLEHSPELYVAFCACVLAGSIPALVPFPSAKVDPSIFREFMFKMLKTINPRALITADKFSGMIPARTIPELVSIDRLPSLPGKVSSSKYVKGLILPESDSPVLLQHSSGTTGLQKAVMITHRALLNNIREYAKALRIGPGAVIASWLPIYHDMGLIAGFLLPLIRGLDLLLLSPFEWIMKPDLLFKMISGRRNVYCWMPNFAFNFCASYVDDRAVAGYDLSGVRAVVSCAEPVKYNSIRRFVKKFRSAGLRACAIQTCYAMAENTFAVTQSMPGKKAVTDTVLAASLYGDHHARPASSRSGTVTIVSSGRPINRNRVMIVDRKLRHLPDRRVGEILIQSNSLFTGYHRRPALNRKVFHDDWFRTGDLGYMVKGECFVLGRMKDVIICKGMNIYLHDVEEIVSEDARIKPGRVVAFGIENRELETEDLVIVAEHRDGSLTDVQVQKMRFELRQKISQLLGVAAREILLVRSHWIVKTTSGKISRNRNRDKYLKSAAGSE